MVFAGIRKQRCCRTSSAAQQMSKWLRSTYDGPMDLGVRAHPPVAPASVIVCHPGRFGPAPNCAKLQSPDSAYWSRRNLENKPGALLAIAGGDLVSRLVLNISSETPPGLTRRHLPEVAWPSLSTSVIAASNKLTDHLTWCPVP